MKLKKSNLLSVLVIFVLIPATLLMARYLPGRVYYITSTAVIIEIMLPFFASFEARKPDARELVIIAVMAALATVSRIAFVFLPHFKPITAIIMISGIAFGAESGFLIGAIAAFASNFYFSQGPWTPWQMFAYGFAGFWAGLIFHGRRKWCNPFVLALFGFLSILCLVGPLLDSCTVFSVITEFTRKNVLVIYGQGVPVNLMHGLSCGLTLAVLTKPLLQKINRIQIKYGFMEKGI